jgi:hypothetical protein
LARSFELAINLETARTLALSLERSPTFISLVDPPMAVALVLWLTNFLHYISPILQHILPAIVGMGAGLFALCRA